MPDLENAIGLILAAHPAPAVHRLMLDLWALGRTHGEAEGLRYAQMYLSAIETYERDRRARAAFGRYPPHAPEADGA